MRRLAGSRALAALLSASLSGCATTVPYVGRGPHPQIERGQPCWLVDAAGNVLAVIPKILLLEWRFANHAMSRTTESYVARYLDANPPVVGQTVVRLNQYAPHRDLARLVTNRNVAWPYRLLLGFPTTLVIDVLLPGRLIPWGDYYNPWTNTAHLYSDHPAIALHEVGHAYDINRRRFKGTYAVARLVPFVDLYQELQASGESVRYFVNTGNRAEELRAYKILYPAFGSYVGGYTFIIGGSVIGTALGHLVGRMKARDRAKDYEALDAQPTAPAVQPPPTPDPSSGIPPQPATR